MSRTQVGAQVGPGGLSRSVDPSPICLFSRSAGSSLQLPIDQGWFMIGGRVTDEAGFLRLLVEG